MIQVLVRLTPVIALVAVVVGATAWAATSDYLAGIAGAILILLASVFIAWSLVPFVQANRDRKQRGA